MERVESWDLKLDDFILSRQNKKFKWGVQDCALFACDCIKEITGQDVAYFSEVNIKTKMRLIRCCLSLAVGVLRKPQRN